MSYLTYLFDLIYNIMVSISIPIPIFIGSHPLYLSIFSIFVGLISISILFYFVFKLLDINGNPFMSAISPPKVNDDIKGVEIDTIRYGGLNRDGTTNYVISKVRRYTKKI